jgi:UDP-N-acetylglucosamine 2-epimerase
MSQVFFDELGLPDPDVNLGIGSGPHGEQTGKMLAGIEEILLQSEPDWVLVYGDTNSTLAGALAAVKLQIPVAHIEAGLRSFNREMPEEHNRVLTDHCADVLFCPTSTAVENLAREGILSNVHPVGDTMYDATLQFLQVAELHSLVLKNLSLQTKRYLLATIHRPTNTDILENLLEILTALLEIGETVVFPVHPRTRNKIEELDLVFHRKIERSKVKLISPVGYLDMLLLEKNARMVLTDSGGMQKEAYFFGVPCVTLRTETEWVETVDSGWNKLVGHDRKRILSAVNDRHWPVGRTPQIFGDGHSSERVVDILAGIKPQG